MNSIDLELNRALQADIAANRTAITSGQASNNYCFEPDFSENSRISPNNDYLACQDGVCVVVWKPVRHAA
jgi:hypothetical protein